MKTIGIENVESLIDHKIQSIMDFDERFFGCSLTNNKYFTVKTSLMNAVRFCDESHMDAASSHEYFFYIAKNELLKLNGYKPKTRRSDVQSDNVDGRIELDVMTQVVMSLFDYGLIL